MIEYLNFGVVPIVMSPNIGDFFDMGYSYILYDDFLSEKFDSLKIKSAIKNNYLIAKKINKITNTGISELKQIIDYMHGFSKRDIDAGLFDLLVENQNMKKLNINYMNEINSLNIQLIKNSQNIDYLNKYISDILTSKRWIFGDILRNPKNILKYLKPKNGNIK